MLLRKNTLLIYSAALLLALQCTGVNDTAGGTTSDVGNGIVTGKVLQPDGTGAQNATVRVVPADFTPKLDSSEPVLFPETNVTSAGRYIFAGITNGVYTIEAFTPTLGTLVDSIIVVETVDTTLVPDAQLRGTGTITGISYLVGIDYYTQSRQTIHILGTSLYTSPEYGGRFLLENIPEGDYILTIKPIPPWEQHSINISIITDTTVNLDTIYSIESGVSYTPENTPKGRMP